jgi:hypothetical protein
MIIHVPPGWVCENGRRNAVIENVFLAKMPCIGIDWHAHRHATAAVPVKSPSFVQLSILHIFLRL